MKIKPYEAGTNQLFKLQYGNLTIDWRHKYFQKELFIPLETTIM
jgi:hypothetical protein